MYVISAINIVSQIAKSYVGLAVLVTIILIVNTTIDYNYNCFNFKKDLWKNPFNKPREYVIVIRNQII